MTDDRYYAGIGSRRTPADVLDLMVEIGAHLARQGWVLRSGHADGADLAFERGAATVPGSADVYLPWPSFNAEQRLPGVAYLGRPQRWALDEGALHHPHWNHLKRSVQPMHGRNVHQVLGRDRGDALSSFVLCWTPDGACRAIDTTIETGGTGQAIRVAEAYGVPVFNLQIDEHRARVQRMLGTIVAST